MSLIISNLVLRLSTSFRIEVGKLEVSSGQVQCILGPSGSGKSSLLAAIGGWLEIDNGRIMLDNCDLSHVSIEKRPVRMCFQKGAHLFPHLNVQDNVNYGLRNVAENNDEDWLLKFGMSEFRDRKVSSLSGGEAQRVSLARTMTGATNVVLLDEFDSGLDAATNDLVKEILFDHCKDSGLKTLFVTHDAADALAISEKYDSNIAVMVNGEMQQNATGRELYTQPKSETVARLTGRVSIARIDGQSPLYKMMQQVSIYSDDQKVLARPESFYVESGPPGEGMISVLAESVIYNGHRQYLKCSDRRNSVLVAVDGDARRYMSDEKVSIGCRKSG